MKIIRPIFMLAVFCLATIAVYAQADFETSLHYTRNGKNYWYGAENNGFETLTNVPIEGLGCVQCHGATDANGDPYPDPFVAACNNCHKTDFSVEASQCLSCHSRQAAEINVHQYSDVHRDAGFVCWDCHPNEDMHGDGTEYNSMLEEGAINADCDDCHDPAALANAATEHTMHIDNIHCTSCHAQSVISCYNCHFESQVEHHVKRAKQQIKNFMLLVNRDYDGKVHPAAFQSLSYQGNTWVAFGPYTPHNITREGRTCGDCHNTMGPGVASIEDYNDDGVMKFATWNDSDSTLSWLQGVVPMPFDYERSFKIDFITFNGDPSSPAGTDNKNWSFVEGDWDGHQMYFCTPMTKDQMAALGFDTTLVTGVELDHNAGVPTDYQLEQNYPNPFNPSTTIRYSVADPGRVSLKVYDMLGNLVDTIVEQYMADGTYTIEWKAKNISSGVYFYTISTPKFQETKKLVLLK